MFKVEYFEDGVKKIAVLSGTPEEIRAKLSQDGKIVLSIKKPAYFDRQVKPKTTDIYAAFKSTADLLNSGVRLTEAIKSVLDTTPSLQMKKVMTVLLDAASDGKDISSAMEPSIFGKTIISMVIAGERSGKLADALDLAAMHIKKVGEMKKDMYKKMTYPLLILIVGVVALLLNTVIIIPKIMESELFQMVIEGQSTAPIEILRVTSYVVPIFILIAITIVFSLYAYYKHSPEEAEKYIIKIPYAKEFLFYRDFFISFFGLSKLLQSGEKLDVALDIIGSSAEFYTVRKDFERSRQCLKNGENFVSGFKHITDIERVMLGTSVNVEKLRNAIDIVSERFYGKYEEKLKGLSPKIYTGVLLFTVVLFVLVAMAIIVPYGRILGGIGD
jgi:type II secretory pathway component PulF